MAGGAVQHSICGGLVAVAMLVPYHPDALRSLADLQPLADGPKWLQKSRLLTIGPTLGESNFSLR
jgi:hypothetical protein